MARGGEKMGRRERGRERGSERVRKEERIRVFPCKYVTFVRRLD